MKKIIFIISIILLLFSCQKQRNVRQVDNFITQIDKRTDLNESLIEFESEINGTELTGGFDIYTFTDKASVIHKVLANVAISNDSLADYEFYFQKDTVVFANVRQFIENNLDTQKLDTLTDSDFYFFHGELIKRIDRKKTDLEVQTVKLVAESYFVFGRDYK